MKKIGLTIFCLVIVLIVTGCGNSNKKVLSCTGLSEGNNMNASADIKYTFENDKLTKAQTAITFQDITVANLSKVWDTFKSQFAEQYPKVEEPGFKQITKTDDKKYTFTVEMDIDCYKISKETREKYNIEDYQGKTYNELKKEAEEELNFKCN